jgi:hypothetical protein
MTFVYVIPILLLEDCTIKIIEYNFIAVHMELLRGSLVVIRVKFCHSCIWKWNLALCYFFYGMKAILKYSDYIYFCFKCMRWVTLWYFTITVGNLNNLILIAPFPIRTFSLMQSSKNNCSSKCFQCAFVVNLVTCADTN